MEKQRTIRQNSAIHKGCQQIADVLVENNITLNKVIQNLEVRPSMNSIKDIFRSIAKAKYGIDSTADLQTNQVDAVWEDLVKAISETTGIFIPFPSQENTEEYLKGKTALFAECVKAWPSSYRYATDGFDRCPHPATWFNAGRYADDVREWRRAGARSAPDRPAAPVSPKLTYEQERALEAENEAFTKRLLNMPEPEAGTLEHAFWLEARKNAAVAAVVETATLPVKEVEHEQRLRLA